MHYPALAYALITLAVTSFITACAAWVAHDTRRSEAWPDWLGWPSWILGAVALPLAIFFL